MKRRIFTIETLLVAAAVSALAPMAESAAEPSRQIGNSWAYELPGNPSTGYQWVLGEAESEGLKSVKVESLGYKPPENNTNLVGAPAQFAFRITCVAAGSAHLYFKYTAPDKTTVGAVRENWINCQ